MLKFIQTLFFLFVVTTGLLSQKTAYPNLSGPYLGQKLPGLIPEIFAPGVISTPNAWEAAISFSPDGMEVFFTRREDIGGIENRIMYMKLVNGKWTQPQLAPFAEEVMEFESYITPDNKKVIFQSVRPNPNGTIREGGIWYSSKEFGTWSEARYFPGPINRGWIMSVTSTLQGTLYFTGNYKAGFGIYKSHLNNGEYGDPEFLPEGINQSKYFGASHPFIAPDESYIIFDAQPEGRGKSELYVSFRDKNNNWSRAVKFDETINKTHTENIATVSPDGKYLFFCRENDIFWVSAKVIEALKPKVE